MTTVTKRLQIMQDWLARLDQEYQSIETRQMKEHVEALLEWVEWAHEMLELVEKLAREEETE